MEDNSEGTQRRGLGTLAWIAIGCGVMIVVLVVAVTIGGFFVAKKVRDVAADFDIDGNPGLAAARMIVKINPELEEVAFDEEEGTITVRHTGTGEEVTVNFEDLKEGRISWKTGDQEITIDTSAVEQGDIVSVTGEDGDWKVTAGSGGSDKVADWVPIYPETEVESSHFMEGDDAVRGVFQVVTEDDVSKVVEFYRSALEEAEYNLSVNTFSGSEGEDGGIINASHESGRTITVMIGTEDGSTAINVTYSEER